MSEKLVSAEDFAAILNIMGKYQHLVDDGDEDGWAGLFTEDGVFAGLPDEQGNPGVVEGYEALKSVPRLSMSQFGGSIRHNVCSFSAEYGATRDEVFARYYAIITNSVPAQGTSILVQVDVRTHLVRIGGGWKIKSNRFVMV